MKNLFLGLSLMVLATQSFAGELAITGDSTNITNAGATAPMTVVRTAISQFGTGAYDLSLAPSVDFKDQFDIKFISGILTSSSEDISLGGADQAKAAPGLMHNQSFDSAGLVGAADAASFCSANAAQLASKVAGAGVSCVAGADIHSVKISIPLSVAYKIQGSMALDVAAMQEQGATGVNPLIDVKLGDLLVANSMTVLNNAKDLGVGADIQSAGYGGLAADKDIHLSYEFPFKGPSFVSQRSSNIKLAVLVKSL